MASSSSSSLNTGAGSSASSRLMPSLSNAGDIAIWLHNKLSSDDIWSDKSSIISQLNADILRNIKTCFTELQLNVKLKLLLSFLHIAKRNLDDWKDELEDLIRMAINDSDLWVSVVAELLLNFPREGIINIDDKSPSFADLSNELKKLVKKQDQKILPLESLFLNRNAFNSSFGQIPPPVKHFALKRKAKSATLRTELLQKASDLSSGKRSFTGTTVPIRCRGLNSSDSTPLKGIPSRNHFSGYSSFGKSSTLSRLSSCAGSISNNPAISRSARLASVASSGPVAKRDGGIVLLDINEAPSANQRDLKRQRKEKTTTASTTTSTITITNTTTKTISTSSISQENLKDNSTSSNIANSNRILGQKNNFESGNQNDDQQQSQKITLQQTKDKFNSNNNMENNENANIHNPIQNNSITSNRILASKSAPDFSAGLLSVTNTSISSTNKSMNQTSLDTIRPNMIQSSQSLLSPTTQHQQPTTMYVHQIPQQQQHQSTTSSIYLNSSSNPTSVNSSNLINSSNLNQTQINQQQPQMIRFSNFTMLNQSLSQQQKSQQLGNFTNFQQPPSGQSQQPNRIIYSYQPQQNQITSSQKSFQSQTQQQTGQFVNPFPNQNQSQQQSNQNFNRSNNLTSSNQPQQQQSLQAPFGMYGQIQSNQTSISNPQRLLIQPQVRITQSAEQLLRDITTKFPQLNENDKSTIINFLNGGANPQPELGPQRNIRLGETVEFRNRTSDGQPVRVMVETQLLMDYDKKICKKMENCKTLTDFSTIRGIGTIGSNPTTTAPQPNIQILNTNNSGGPRMAVGVHQTSTVGLSTTTALPINITQMMTPQPGLTIMTMTPSGELRPFNALIQSQTIQQNNPQQQQYSHLQQRV